VSLFRPQRTAAYKPWLFYFCLFALAWATALLFAGGFTTSIRAGMAFLDWPLSDGSINPEGWLGERDELAEHSHRLLGLKIGLLAIALAAWTGYREARPKVRALARVLLLTVVLQGVLGGARVRFDQLNLDLPTNLVAQSFAVAHACGAQAVVGLLVALACLTSRWGAEGAPAGFRPPADTRLWGAWATGAIFVQIAAGAVMRHAGAGLAIARFPLAAENSVLPAHWNFATGIHFAHRAGAVAVGAVALVFAARLWRARRTSRAAAVGGPTLALLLGGQIYLGALTIWTAKNPHVATLHMLGGAFLLATAWALTLLLFLPRASPRPGPGAARTPEPNDGAEWPGRRHA